VVPGFVDPHVHLRTPGREDEETIESGTRAAAAGGYCAIFAMPNTEPVIDSAAVLGALVETAQKEAEIPVGFLGAITKGQQGGELTEMAELADAGAYQPGDVPFDVVSCIGATWIGGGLAGRYPDVRHSAGCAAQADHRNAVLSPGVARRRAAQRAHRERAVRFRMGRQYPYDVHTRPRLAVYLSVARYSTPPRTSVGNCR